MSITSQENWGGNDNVTRDIQIDIETNEIVLRIQK